MLNIREYLEDIRHVLDLQSPAQFKMFIYHYMANDPRVAPLLDMNRSEIKLYMQQLRKELLPVIDEYLELMEEDLMH